MLDIDHLKILYIFNAGSRRCGEKTRSVSLMASFSTPLILFLHSHRDPIL